MTTMSSSLQVPGGGKSRSRKSSGTTLMALDEEGKEDSNHKELMLMPPSSNKTDLRKYSDSNLPSPIFSDMPAPQKKQKASRRSSLGLGLLMGGGGKSESHKSNGNKRRSSIAAILGRKNSKVCVNHNLI